MTGLWWRPQWSSFLLLFWKQRTMWPLGIMEPQEGKLPAYEDQTIGLLCVQEIITLSSLDTETLVFVRTADVTLVNKETVILLLGLQLFCAKLLQFCLTLCNPIDCSPLGSSVHGILQARILEWVAMPSSRGSSGPRDRTHVSWVSCTAKWILYHWVTWETLSFLGWTNTGLQLQKPKLCVFHTSH